MLICNDRGQYKQLSNLEWNCLGWKFLLSLVIILSHLCYAKSVWNSLIIDMPTINKAFQASLAKLVINQKYLNLVSNNSKIYHQLFNYGNIGIF